MPSSQAAATERRNDKTAIAHEPPKLKTTLKTPPKQATNPLQFVKVGPCSLYRSAQEQLQKVEETKKIKQEVRDDPEDWQSNLDNWKSSRRKRQEHIIERVVEVKKLELEEHDRLRRRSKTFSEMMEERGSRGRKLSMSLAMYHEEDANDLSDLGIGTSSGKSSVSGDTHDDTQSVTSDRDSEIEKNHSDVENVTGENDNGNDNDNALSEINDEISQLPQSSPSPPSPTTKMTSSYRSADEESNENDTSRVPEPEAEYTYEGAIRGYVSRVSQNIPRRSFIGVDTTTRDEKAVESRVNEQDSAPASNDGQTVPLVKVDVPKRREIFERASRDISDNTRTNSINNTSNINNNNNNNNNNITATSTTNTNNNNNNNNNSSNGNFNNSMSRIKDRLSSLERQKSETESAGKKDAVSRLSGDMCSIRERLAHLEKQTSERESKVGIARPFGVERNVGKNSSTTTEDDGEASVSLESMTSREFVSVDCTRKESNVATANDERSLPPPPPRASFHRSLDSLDTDASSGPDMSERVQSLEELDYTTRYPVSSSSVERFNDTDREDSGIHTADASSSVSQADEEVVTRNPETRRYDGTRRDFMIEETELVEDDDSRKSTIEISMVADTENDTRIVKQRDDSSSTTGQEDNRRNSNEPNKVESIVTAEHCPTPTDRTLFLDSDQRISRDPNEICDQASLSATSSPSAFSKKIPQFDLINDDELLNGLTFPLRPPTSVEPPKEKPPPPPTELSDDEENLTVDQPLKRLNSTRRIKKELRTRRSDFLGIEGTNDDYLDRQLNLTKPPPDMIAILTEERRIEQRNRRSYDTDSNYERDSSHERDSGVELGHAEDWSKQPVSPDMSQHSRQSSEPFGASVTSSEEDEITKKEREIIEVLEKEEQWRYGNDRDHDSDIGEKLAHKLRELEEEKMRLERERARATKPQPQCQDENLRKKNEEGQEEEEEEEEEGVEEENDEKKKNNEGAIEPKKEEILREKRDFAARQQQDAKIVEDKKIREKETLPTSKSDELEIHKENKEQKAPNNRIEEDEFTSGEVLRVERELLQLEQEELKRRRTNVAYREQRRLQLAANHLQEQWQSLQDVANGSKVAVAPTSSASSSCSSSSSSSRYKYEAVPAETPFNYRSSMPNLWLQEGQRRRLPPPPPIPPSKPTRLIEHVQRDVTIRSSRIPSADSIPQQVEIGSLGGSMSNSNVAQQMTRQTLQALSAVPRSRIVKGDEWVQRRKSDLPRGTLEYNYQHWLIQEAEQRRIGEQNQRTALRKAQQHVTGTSVPYTALPSSSKSESKPLPDSIIQTLTQRVQNRAHERPPPPPPQRRRLEQSASHEHLTSLHHHRPTAPQQHIAMLQHRKIHQFSSANNAQDSQEKMLSVSGKKKCSHCSDELGRGAAMIIESLRLFYHMECFKCCVCHVRLGDGLMGTDVRVRNHKLHCHNCYSSDDGVKFSCV